MYSTFSKRGECVGHILSTRAFWRCLMNVEWRTPKRWPPFCSLNKSHWLLKGMYLRKVTSRDYDETLSTFFDVFVKKCAEENTVNPQKSFCSVFKHQCTVSYITNKYIINTNGLKFKHKLTFNIVRISQTHFTATSYRIAMRFTIQSLAVYGVNTS